MVVDLARLGGDLVPRIAPVALEHGRGLHPPSPVAALLGPFVLGAAADPPAGIPGT